MQQRRSRSIVQDKSFDFAVRLTDCGGRLRKASTDLVLTSQLLRSGTPIGANAEEAWGGQSSINLMSTLALAAGEAREARYWLRLLRDTQPHHHWELGRLLTQCDELVTMLNSIIMTICDKFVSADSRFQPRTHNSELPDT